MPLESEPSVVPGILLSDVSIVEQGTQKRSIIGSFDQFMFAQFPANYGRFFITAWITNMQGGLSELEVTTRIQEVGSAHVVFSTSTRAEFGEERKFERDNTMGISTAVAGIVFPKPGRYVILLLMNGEEVGKREVNVLQQVQKTKE